MSLEMGILGFLEMKPLSGYDIKKLFDMSASYFWPADQAQIYRTLKKLVRSGLAELIGRRKGETVDKKVYAITVKGRKEYLAKAAENGVEDFISRDLFLMQLFFCGALPRAERLEFIDKQLDNVRALERRLIDNYDTNLGRYTDITGLDEKDGRLHSAVCAYRWGLVKCREYAKLLEEIRAELLA